MAVTKKSLISSMPTKKTTPVKVSPKAAANTINAAKLATAFRTAMKVGRVSF